MNAASDSGRWVQLGLLAVVELLAMALWFSASAVTPALARDWNLSAGDVAWLTISVQLGFVAGALASAALNLSERWSPPRMMATCALLGALCNFLIAQLAGSGYESFVMVIVLRFLTGALLAGVYPTGMKLMATWFVRGRGFAIGVLVGALTVGSALPHLINALPVETWLSRYVGDVDAWRVVMMVASACAVLAAVIAALLVRTGPHLPAATRLDWSYFFAGVEGAGAAAGEFWVPGAHV